MAPDTTEADALTCLLSRLPNGHHENPQGQGNPEECVRCNDLFVRCILTRDPEPSAKVTQAKTAKKAALQGAHAHSSRKTRLSVSFHRPKTLKLAREPRYPRKSVPHAPRMDQFRTIVSCVERLIAIYAC